MKESLGHYVTRGGKSLAYRKWNGPGEVIVCLHGLESNSGWFSYFSDRLNDKGFTVYGIDRRGSGLNQGNGRGDIKDYNILLDDIEDALQFVREQNIGREVYLLGICWGGLLALNYIAKLRPQPAGLILLSPAVYRKVDLSIYAKSVAKACVFMYPEARLKIPIRDHMFTANRRYLDFITNDKMRLRSLTCRFFNEILRMEKDLSGINHRISLPLAVGLAGHDQIVDNSKIKEWFKRVESADKTIKVFEDMRHVMPFEENIDPLIDFVTGWVKTKDRSVEPQGVKN